MKCVLITCVLALLYRSTSAQGHVCTTSFTCGTNSCCRDASDKVISTAQGNHPGGFVDIVNHPTGTCSSKLAQKGEKCDTSCTCDTGLSCARHMAGGGIHPQTCVDPATAKQEFLELAKCLMDPTCTNSK